MDDVERLLIHELIGLQGHLMDEGAFDRLTELFTDDVVYDVTALGGGQLIGPTAVAQAGEALGEGNPVAHHVTNIVVTPLSEGSASAISKGLGVMADGSVGSVLYEDDLERTSDGWRIKRRRVLPRERPMSQWR